MPDPFAVYSAGKTIYDYTQREDRDPRLPANNLGSSGGLFARPLGQFAGRIGDGGAGAYAAGKSVQLLGEGGRTSPDLFNRILAGSSRATGEAQRALSSRGARSGIDSGIQDALAAAIDLEGADREVGIRSTEASLSEDRRRADIAAFTQNVIHPLLQAMGIDAGVSTNQAQISAQQGNQELQSAAAIIGALSNLGGRRRDKEED